jgi:hypothetical protein
VQAFEEFAFASVQSVTQCLPFPQKRQMLLSIHHCLSCWVNLLFEPNLPVKSVLVVDLEACLDCHWPLLEFLSDFLLFKLLVLLFGLLLEDLLSAAFSGCPVLASRAFSVCHSQYQASMF